MVNSLSLKQMIFAGFGLVLALLALLAAFASRGTVTLGSDFTEYRQAARESLLVNEANATLLRARLAVMKFRADNREEFVNEVNSELQHLLVLKNELTTFIQDPARVDQVTSFTTSAQQYLDAFGEVVTIQADRNLLVPQMNAAGRDARSVLSELMREANSAGNAEAAYLAGVVQQHLMLARYYGEKYLLANQLDDKDRTLEELRLAEASIGTLQRMLRRSDLIVFVDSYNDHAARFEALFSEIGGLIVTRNDILASQLDTIGPQLANGYGAVLQGVVDTQNTVGPRAAAEVNYVTNATMGIAGTALLLGFAAAAFIGTMLAKSIKRVTADMTQLAEGNLDVEIQGAKRKDELGDMARALLVFQDNGRDRLRMQARQEEQAAQTEAERRQAFNEMADNFEANVNSVVTGVASAADQMVSLAQGMSGSAERAGDRSTAVAAAAEEGSTNVETVAAASEEMTNTLAEVTERVSQSAAMTDQAARGAEHTMQTVSKLAKSAQTIGDVISLISDIAEQTNLLALNATIEAARAGEAGKGFAVVASEVKSLANQTAKATEEISAQITGMQGDTDAVVAAIEKIGSMIQELNSTSASIAAAVEEQHSATQEIARNTAQAADGTREVSANISEVSSAVQETGQAANEVLGASSKLANEADQLSGSVADFLKSVRSA